MEMNEWIQKATDSLAALHKEEEDLKYALEKIMEPPQKRADFTDINQEDTIIRVRRTCSNCGEFYYLDTPTSYYYKYCPYCGFKIGKITSMWDMRSNKAQVKPKILSIEEIFNTPENKVIWLEHSDGTFNPVYNPEHAFVSFDMDHEVPAISFNGANALILDDYKKFWRCWSEYVDIEKRDKTPWEN